MCFSHNAVGVFARDYLNSAAVFEILKNGHEFLILPPKIAPAARAEKWNISPQEKNISGAESVIDDIICEFPLKVKEYKKGKKTIADMFRGEAVKRLKGKADPQATNETIVSRLNAIK